MLEQEIGLSANHLEPTPPLGGDPFLLEELVDGAKDRREGRVELVAHRGEELRLKLVRPLDPRVRLHQLQTLRFGRALRGWSRVFTWDQGPER